MYGAHIYMKNIIHKSISSKLIPVPINFNKIVWGCSFNLTNSKTLYRKNIESNPKNINKE